jgi:hypothetical protein
VAGDVRYKDLLHAFGESATKAALAPSDDTLQSQLAHARSQLLTAAGPTALADAAGVAASFNMITRVVDASGHANSATERHVQAAVARIARARSAIGAGLLAGGLLVLAILAAPTWSRRP